MRSDPKDSGRARAGPFFKIKRGLIMFDLNSLLADSIRYLTSDRGPLYCKCELCKTPIIDLQTGQQDILYSNLRKCRDCFHGKKKLCKCGSWHMTGSSKCLECFIEDRKKRKNNE